MAVHDSIFSRFLFCFCAVVEDKTKIKVEIPEWIIKSKNREVKVKFLQGLFDSELSKIAKIKNKILAYQGLKFYTCKSTSNVKDGVSFLNQIRKILKGFDITTSKVTFDRKYVRSRDNSNMQPIFLVSTRIISICANLLLG